MLANKPYDLGKGWTFTKHINDSATISNTFTGLRIDLPAASLATLRRILDQHSQDNAA